MHNVNIVELVFHAPSFVAGFAASFALTSAVFLVDYVVKLRKGGGK